MFKMSIMSLLLGLIALLAGIQMFYLSPAAPGHLPSLDWNVTLTRVESGKGTRIDQNLRLQLNESGRGIIALPIPRVQSNDYPFLHLSFANSPQNLTVLILWRTTRTGDKVHHYQVAGDPGASLWLDARGISEWVGDITSLGVVVMGQPGEQVTFTDVSLHQATLPRQLQAIYHGWTGFSPWRHSSINTHRGVISAATSFYPVPMAAILLTLSLLAYIILLRLLRAKARFDWRVVSFIFLFCWIGLDLIWQGRLWRQLSQTYETFNGKDTAGKLAVGIDAQLTDFVNQVKKQVDSDDTRIFVGSSDDYMGMRAAYYLYPFNVFWERKGSELPSRDYLHGGDYIVLVEPTQTSFDPSKRELLAPENEAISVDPIISGRIGSLFRVQ